MVKDPVCGMYMDSRLAVQVHSQDAVIYFCSEECKEKFLAQSPGEGTGSAAAG